MKKTILMLIAVVAFTFTSCKNDKNASKDSSDNAAQTENATAQTDQDGANQDAATGDQDDANKDYPEINFHETDFDFGTISEGDVVQHEFTFTNTGKAPLKVLEARPSCGCTVPSWSKDEIAPGEKGSMMVKFNSRGKHGKQHKSVRLTTNTKSGSEILRFSANVEKK